MPRAIVPEDLAIPPLIHYREPFVPTQALMDDCERCLERRGPLRANVYWVPAGNQTNDEDFHGMCVESHFLAAMRPLPLFGHYICSPEECYSSSIVAIYAPQRVACFTGELVIILCELFLKSN